MSEKPYRVYIIQGRGQRDYTDSQVNTEVYAAGHQRRPL